MSVCIKFNVPILLPEVYSKDIIMKVSKDLY